MAARFNLESTLLESPRLESPRLESPRLESPFLSGELFAPEARIEPTATHSPFLNFDFSQTEDKADEADEADEAPCCGDHAHEHDHDHEFDAEFDDEDNGFEAEAPGCAGEDMPQAGEFEGSAGFEGEVWSGSAEQAAFRDRVLAAHLASKRVQRGAPQRDWPEDALRPVPGTDVSSLPDTAAAAGRLLAAANADLATAQSAGDADALRTIKLSATSGYRGSDHQRELWIRYFSAKGGYYDRTQAAREGLAEGPHSEQAVAYMLRRKKAGGFGLGGRIAAPGYSNHQGGIAIDFSQVRHQGHRVANKSDDTARARWRASWFHHWLKDHAALHGFKPIDTEEWHWEYKPGVGTSKPEPAAPSASASAPASSASGGRFWTFKARSVPITVGVYSPKAAAGLSPVDLLVFAHGLLDVCGGPANAAGLVLHRPFNLAKIIDAAPRPVVLVVPQMDWPHHRGTHPLARPAALNGVLAEVLRELGRLQGGTAPALGALILSGHSRAYGLLGPLARAHADPEMAQGALARLAEIWALDTTYEFHGSHDAASTEAWLDAKPQLRMKIVFRTGSKTARRARLLANHRHDRLELIEVPPSEAHCAVPVARLPGLLRSIGAGAAEKEDETFAAEWLDEDSFVDEEDGEALDAHRDDADEVWAEEGAADEADFEADLEAESEAGRPDPYDLAGREHEWEDDEAVEAFDDELEVDDETFDTEREFESAAVLEHDSPQVADASAATLREAIVAAALKEWERWGRGASKETAAEMRPYLVRYWSAVIERRRVDKFIDKRHAWSAAFVSWVMKQAGAGSAFQPSPYHTGYIAAAKKNRGVEGRFQAFRIDEVAIEVGDVVCKDRRPRSGAACAGTTYDNVDTRNAQGDARISHGDIVLEVDSARHRARVIGGNVGNSVADGWIRLSDNNRLPAAARGGCAYIAVLKPPGAAVPSRRAPATTTSPASPASPASSSSPRTGQTLPTDPSAFRRFRLTTYHVVDQAELPTGTVRIPILDDHGRKIAEGSPAFFGQLALEGTGRLDGNRLVNVTGKTVAVAHDDYADVLAYHRQAYAGADRKRRENGRSPTPTQYSGIVVAHGRVVRAFAFHEVAASARGVGYGMSRGIPYTPFRTLAADIGTLEYAKVAPTWKGKGGLVPVGTRVYIKEYDGLALPDGSTHDGWFTVNDTGGAIFGAHFDVFTGTRAMRKGLKLPEFGQVWFAGIEQRVPVGYTHGLRK
jgi:LAS superfamily LD-carboxypeptidase LdcB